MNERCYHLGFRIVRCPVASIPRCPDVLMRCLGDGKMGCLNAQQCCLDLAHCPAGATQQCLDVVRHCRDVAWRCRDVAWRCQDVT